MTNSAEPFHGAKLILFAGAKLVVIRRDDIPTIPWPGMLDFPGGGREGDETPEQCVSRETYEELGLRLDVSQLTWLARHNNGVFFVARLAEGAERDIRFGTEGQGWQLMDPEDYIAAPDAIPHFVDLLCKALAAG